MFAGAGQSGRQSFSPQPNQPQNQPSREPAASRTMTAAPEVGIRCSGSTPAQAAAGGGNISLTMIAPSGTGDASIGTACSSARFDFSQSIMSGEYQVTTGAWVPK